MPKRAESRDLPFGAQFSPEQTPLPELLALLEAKACDHDRLVKAIREKFFEKESGSDHTQTKQADNTTLALQSYGILGEDKASLTDRGRRLVAVRRKPAPLYDMFARHILVNLSGLGFVCAVLDLQQAGEEISLEALPTALARRGIRVRHTSTDISTMQGWLQIAGVFTGGRFSYVVNEAQLEELIAGLKPTDVDALDEL